jgi:Ricin-type beta-trefoil lectin domain
VGSNRCIDVHNSNAITADRELVLFDCTGQASQVLLVEQRTDGQVSLRNESHPDLCMDIRGAPPTPDGGHLIVWPCSGEANQEFMFTSFDPTGTPEPEQAEY